MIPREVLEKSVNSVVGKEVRFMHISPEEDVEKGFLGQVEKVYWQDGEPFVEFYVDGKTKTQKYIQDVLWHERYNDRDSKNLPDISAGIISIETADGNMVDAIFREVSIVDQGACVDCYIRSVERFGKAFYNAKKGELKMAADNDSGSANVGADKRDIAVTTNIIAQYQKNIAERDETIKTQAGMLDKIRSDVSELTIKMNEYKADNENMKQELEDSKTLAMREQIVKYRGYKPESEEYLKRLEFYKKFPKEALVGLIEDDKREQERRNSGFGNRNEEGIQFDTISRDSFRSPKSTMNTTSDDPKHLSQMEYRVGQTQKDKYEIEYPLGRFKFGSG